MALAVSACYANMELWLLITYTCIKCQVMGGTLIILVPDGEGPWSYLVSQSRQICKFQVQWETLSQNRKVGSDWGRYTILTCRFYIHSHILMCINTHTHTLPHSPHFLGDLILPNLALSIFSNVYNVLLDDKVRQTYLNKLHSYCPLPKTSTSPLPNLSSWLVTPYVNTQTCSSGL